MTKADRAVACISRYRMWGLAVLGALCMSACASAPPSRISLYSGPAHGSHSGHDARVHALAANPSGARYKIGAPYQAGGVWYVPAEQPNYNEVGIASWYGDQFNGKPTADGETFNMNGITAAHATLPIPCMVEVTNLDNGRTIKVRVNDRGPFHATRIIDMSRGAAQALGFYAKGTARVRVRYVGPASLSPVDAPLQFAANRSFAPPPVFGPPAAPISPPPSPLVPATERDQNSDGYFIQAGAFAERANAERAASRLAAAGRTDIRPLDRNGATLYRVVVGRWSDASAADAVLDRVAALGFGGAKVIPGS